MTHKSLSKEERVAPFLALLEARYAPLLCSVAPQAYTVFLWLWEGSNGSWAAFVFSILGALGYESVYVGAIAWALEGRKSLWTWATAVVALVFSVLVAGYVYYDTQGWWALLHSGFPVVGFCYTMALHSQQAQGRVAIASPLPADVPVALPIPTPELTLDELLARMGKTREEMLAILARFGMMDTKAEFVYARLKQHSALPDGITPERFAVLLEELRGDSKPTPADTPKKPKRAASKPTARPGGITKRSRVRSALDEHGNLKDSELYGLLPDISQSSIRVHASEWRKEYLAATNGRH